MRMARKRRASFAERGRMSERRSTRHKRAVDYRKFADGNSDDDDDFESSVPLRNSVRGDQGTGRVPKSNTTPPTAAAIQQKTFSSERQRKESLLDVGEDGPPAPKKARQSRDERKFSKDTEKAMRESAKETSSSPHSSPNSHRGDTEYQPHREEDEEEEEEYVSEGDVSSDSDFSDDGPALSKRGGKNNKKPAGKGGKTTSVGKTTAQTKPQQKKTANRIGVENKKTTNRIGVGNKKTANEVENKKTKTQLLKTAISTAKPAVSAGPTAISSSSVASSPRLGVRKMPKWTPPGPANRENHSRDCNLASNGGTPLIRVGLSRRARVKPLHNSPHIPS